MGNLYKILSYLSGPFLKLYFYTRCLFGKDNWKDVQNHFGQPNKSRPDGRLFWFHAASIGESTSALTYIKHLKQLDSNLNILLTTITTTSASILNSKLQNMDGCIHQFVVADNPVWINKFLDYWKPDKIFFLESEIWPNMVDIIHKRNIPLFLLNARLSLRSFERWKHLKKFFSSILCKFTAILAQSEIDKQKFAYFSNHNVYRIDNLKYANELLPCNQSILDILKKICLNKKIFVAISTHQNEEEEIIKAHLELQKKFNITTVIIPRHLTRIQEIKKLFQQYKVPYVLLSEIQNNPDDSIYPSVICIDAFGLVGTCLRLADITFVGGSLVPIGGHNIYEPVSFGKPVLFGPYMGNALDVKQLVIENQVGFEITSYKDIVDKCEQLFNNLALVSAIENRCKSITHNDSLKQIDKICL